MGAAGAATGFARTVPMRDEPSWLKDTASESEDKQIRFWEQAEGLRGFAPISGWFFSCVQTGQSPFRIGLTLTPHNS